MKKTTVLTLIGVIVIGGIAYYSIRNSEQDLALEKSNDILDSTDLALEKTQNKNKANQNNSGSIYNIIFYKNGEPQIVGNLSNGVGKPKISSKKESIETITTEKKYTTSAMPKEMLKGLNISNEMIFYSGLQSNTDSDLWIYTERNMRNTDYNVRLFNTSTKKSEVLFGQNDSPDKKYAFKPIAINSENTIVYLEALVFGSSTEHEGIWTINLESGKFKNISIYEHYVSTPTLSPDGEYLMYTAASQQNDIHVPANQLFIYDLKSNEEINIMSDKDSFVSQPGWVKRR